MLINTIQKLNRLKIDILGISKIFWSRSGGGGFDSETTLQPTGVEFKTFGYDHYPGSRPYQRKIQQQSFIPTSQNSLVMANVMI